MIDRLPFGHVSPQNQDYNFWYSYDLTYTSSGLWNIKSIFLESYREDVVFGAVTFESGYPKTSNYKQTVIQDVIPMKDGLGSGFTYPMPYGTNFPANLPLSITISVACLNCMPGSSARMFEDSVVVQPFHYYPPYANSLPYLYKP